MRYEINRNNDGSLRIMPLPLHFWLPILVDYAKHEMWRKRDENRSFAIQNQNYLTFIFHMYVVTLGPCLLAMQSLEIENSFTSQNFDREIERDALIGTESNDTHTLLLTIFNNIHITPLTIGRTR